MADIVDLADSWYFCAAAGAAARRTPKTPNFNCRLASDHETKSKYSEKNANYSAKSTIFSQKQRLYTYDRGVYAPTLYHYRFKSHYKQMDPAIVTFLDNGTIHPTRAR